MTKEEKLYAMLVQSLRNQRQLMNLMMATTEHTVGYSARQQDSVVIPFRKTMEEREATVALLRKLGED